MRRQALLILLNAIYALLLLPLRPAVAETLKLPMISVGHHYTYTGKNDGMVWCCGGNFLASRPISEEKQGMTIVTEHDHGKRIEVAQGGTLVVKLESSPGTGYSWHMAKVNRNLLEPMGEPTLEESKSGLMGAPAHQVYRFKARDLGSTELELQYVRSWEKDRAPLKTFNIVVRVLP
jgi:inhibitor of cysteine peptidase